MWDLTRGAIARVAHYSTLPHARPQACTPSSAHRTANCAERQLPQLGSDDLSLDPARAPACGAMVPGHGAELNIRVDSCQGIAETAIEETSRSFSTDPRHVEVHSMAYWFIAPYIRDIPHLNTGECPGVEQNDMSLYEHLTARLGSTETQGSCRSSSLPQATVQWAAPW